MSNEELKELNDYVTEAFGIGHENSVLQKLQQRDVFSLPDSRFKIELLELQADLIKSMPDEDVMKFFDELIRLNPDNERYYEIAATRTKDIKFSIQYMEQAYSRFPNDYYTINSYIERLLDYCELQINPETYSDSIALLEALIGQSRSLYNYIDNKVFYCQLRFIKLLYSNKPDEYNHKINELCATISSMSKFHPQTLKILQEVHSAELSKKQIVESLEFYKKSDSDKFVEMVYMELIDWVTDHEDFSEVIKLFNEYEKSYVGSDEYKCKKAQLLMTYEYLDDALAVYNSFDNTKDVVKRKMEILMILNRRDEVDELYEKIDKEDFELIYLETTKQYDRLVEYYSAIERPGNLNKIELNSYAYSLLRCGKYKEVEKLLKPYYDNPVLADGVIIVNYLFARKKQGYDVTKSIKKKITENQNITYSENEMLGAYCVLEDRNESYKYLTRVLKKDPVDRYLISEWPIMSQFMFDRKFADLFKIRNNKL